MTSATSLSPADQAKIAQAMETPKPCILCGSPPAWAGLFFPDWFAVKGRPATTAGTKRK